MAHGWNSYFHNFPPLSSDPGTLRTAECEGTFPQQAENFIGHNAFSGTAATQGALLPNSSFNANSCMHSCTDNSSTDCVYQNYCSEWRTDGEYLEKDYMQRCEEGESLNFAREKEPEPGTFSSPFPPNLQGLKQDCEILPTACLGNYSNVSSCSDPDASETRPSCKFMEGDFFSKQKLDSLSKGSTLACFFSKTGSIPFLSDDTCTTLSETNANLLSNMKDRKNMASWGQDKVESLEKEITAYAGPDQFSTTSSMLATTENKPIGLNDGINNDCFQDHKQKQDMERNIQDSLYPDYSMSENVTGDEHKHYPLNEESRIISAAAAIFGNQQDKDEKKNHEIQDKNRGFRNLDSTDGLSVSEDVQGNTQVIKRQREEKGSLENKISHKDIAPIHNSTPNIKNCEEKETQKNASQLSIKPVINELSSKVANKELSKCSYVNKSHDPEFSVHFPAKQSPESVSQDYSSKSLAETKANHLSDSNVSVLSQSCLQPIVKKDKIIDKETNEEEELADTALKACADLSPAIDCDGPVDMSDCATMLSKDTNNEMQGVTSHVESGFQSHSTSTGPKPQMHGQLTSTAKTPALSLDPNCCDPIATDDKMARDTDDENYQNVNVKSCLQLNVSGTSIPPSLDISLLEKVATNCSNNPDCSAPDVSSDSFSDICDKNNKKVENDPESCLESQCSETDRCPSPAQEKTQKMSSDCSDPSLETDHLSSDARDNNKKQSVATKPESCLHPDNLGTDVSPYLTEEWTNPAETTSTSAHVDPEDNSQALTIDRTKPSVDYNLETCYSSKLDSSSEEEWVSPIDNANTTSLPDLYQSLQESLSAEDVSENARESFGDLDYSQDQSLPDLLYGEPLSREDSYDSDETKLDSLQYQEMSVINPEEYRVDCLEKAAPELQSSFQMRDFFHPVVVLNTLEPKNGISDPYHCTDCQVTTQKLDHLIEHHYSCHPMINFQFCNTCDVYLISNEEGNQHFCGAIKENQALFSDSVPVKKRKFQGRHKCKKCGLIFSKILLYVKHMRSHTGKTPYRCNGCGVYFAQPSSLRRHKNVPQRCKASQLPVSNSDVTLCKIEPPEQDVPQKDEPPKLFDESIKNCYVKLFDISKRNLCHICGKSFASLRKAKRHIYDVHKKKKMAAASNESILHTAEVKNEPCGKYKCPLCPRLFKYSYNRARHLRDCIRNATYGGRGKVGDKYVCPLCTAAFTLPSNRFRHIKVLCLKECLNRLAREKSKSWTGTKPAKNEKPQLKDDVQDTQSTVNVQKVQRKEEVPRKQPLSGLLTSKPPPSYKCTQCPAVFSYASGKYRHMKKHELFKLTGKKFKYRNSVWSVTPNEIEQETDDAPNPTNTEERTDELQTFEETAESAPSCHFCGKCFHSLSFLKKHERTHRGERPYRCLECGKGFKKRTHLLGHKIVHQKRIQCTVCKKILSSVTELIQHRRSHLKKGMLKCPDCPQQFQYPVYLLRHLKRHTNKDKKMQQLEEETATKPMQPLEAAKDHNETKQVQCSLCKEVFDDPHILRKHCLTHISGSSSNQCPFCKHNFNSRRYLLRHMVKHTGDKSFSCSNCGKQFYRSMFLELHAQKCLPPPTEELISEESNSKTKNPYHCSICPRKFSKKDRLQNHLIAHKKNALHLCSKCEQYFGPNKISRHQAECGAAPNQKLTPTNLKKTSLQPSQNINKTPSQSKPAMLLHFKCPYCSQKFRYRSLYLRHLVSHTGVQPYACVRCGERFGSQTMCFKHEAFCDGVKKMEDPKFKSEGATKMDSLREETKKVLQKGDVEYKCKFCTKTFTKPRNLRYHILSHNEVKPYRCKACDSCFSRYDHLKVHQSRCKIKKTRLEVRIPKISLDDVGKGWQSKLGIKQLENHEAFNCKVCFRSFPTQSKLSRHFTMFHGPKPFKCTRCGASFSHDKTLRKHRKMRKCRKPTSETNASLPLETDQPAENVTRPLSSVRNRLLLRIQPFLNKTFKYICGFCPRSFKNSWQLSVHTRLHTGERPYSCENCGERFIRKDYLKRHYLKCTKTLRRSKVLCDRCGGFFFESQLESHKKFCASKQTSPKDSQGQKTATHSPPKGFSCAYCSSKFLLFSQLQEHFLSKHKQETMNSPISAAPLQQLLSNIPKIKEEPFDGNCDGLDNDPGLICKTKTTDINKAFKQFICQECNMAFVNKAGLTGHQRIHTTEHPFKCKVCDRGFWNKTILRNHYRKCKPKTTQQLEGPLKAKIDFALNDSKHVSKEHNATGAGVLHTSSAESFQVKEEEEETSVQSYDGAQSSSNKEKKAVQYQCSECDKSFTDGLLLISHLEDHGRQEQEKKSNTCSKCGRVCSNQANLEKHMRFHRSNMKYSCKDCSKVFISISDLKRHNLTHAINKPFCCKLCKQRFLSRPSLCEHYCTQHADVIFHCQFCSKVYAVKKSLARHYKTWHPKEWKNFRSTVLEKSGSEQQSGSHVSTTGESDENDIYCSDSESDSAPYFPCHVCGKTFPTSENLEDHQLCHLGEKPHECAECGKCFFLASQLQQHQRMHKFEFQCQTCGRGFVTLFALRNHKHSHSKNRPHRCSRCQLSFPGHMQLAEHMSTHREESFPCDLCNLVFQSKSSRAEHRNVHYNAGDYPLPSVSTEEPEQSESSLVYTMQFKYRCGVCTERFRDPEELSEHGCLEAKERPYSCTDCNKHFLHASHLKKHQSTHQPPWSIREYPCNQCNSSYSSSQHFLSHLESHVASAAGNAHTELLDSFICPVCHQCFDNPIELIHHFPTHPDGTGEPEKNQLYPSGSELSHNEKRYLISPECTECGESFLGGDAFHHHQCFREQHTRSESKYSNLLSKNPTHRAAGEEEEVDVTGEDLYKCLDCSMQFSSKSSLLEHQNKLHQDRKQFECERCGKTFAKMRYLRKHESRHRLKEADSVALQQIDTRFKCGQCSTKFKTPEELSLHMRLHAEEQAGEFRCDMCYKSFSQRSLLKQHQESHVGEVVYECTECDKAFAFPHLLEEHQQTHAGSSQ